MSDEKGDSIYCSADENAPEWTQWKNKNDGDIFARQRIIVDERKFENCRFIECTLVYHGGPLFIHGCFFEHCKFELAGAAKRTIYFVNFTGGAAS